jgi:predicted esterase
MAEEIRKVSFIESPDRDVPDCFISIVGPAAPTLVAIHGISRNAAEMAARFAGHRAFAGVNIVAPLFDRARFGKYQQLTVNKNRETLSDRALFKLLNRLTVDHGINTHKILLFGFSGGAQMAHRIAMLFPSRIQALCAAAAGWYMMPDRLTPYPYGLADAIGEPGHAEAFIHIPTTVVVGSLDNRIDDNVCQDARVIDKQGRTRLRRARVWSGEMANYARSLGHPSNIELVVLDGGSHDFGQCVLKAGLIETVAKALLGK